MSLDAITKSRAVCTIMSAARSDYLLRLPLAAVFGAMAVGTSRHVSDLISSGDYTSLTLASVVANLVFTATLLLLTVFRGNPVRKGSGVLPKIGAFFGAFLPLGIATLPHADLPAWLGTVALLMVTTGCVLSLWTVSWLGRSLSMTAQARRVVTGGPYAIVRHPLYLTEELAVVGIVIAHASWLAGALALVHWCFQLKRIDEEEQVLRTTFEQYTDYSARVPRLLPRPIGRLR